MENILQICELNNLEIHTQAGHILFAIASELARALFPFEYADNIKIKVTRRRFIGDGCIWEGMLLMNTC